MVPVEECRLVGVGVLEAQLGDDPRDLALLDRLPLRLLRQAPARQRLLRLRVLFVCVCVYIYIFTTEILVTTAS